MIEILLIALKFAALIVGGVFAAIGLLTNYRHEDGTVSKWGKIALFGIILSTIIAAGTQAVESFRDRQTTLANDSANRKSEGLTQIILEQTRRALFPLNNVALKLTLRYPIIKWPISDFVRSVPENEGALYFYPLTPESSIYPKTGMMRQLLEPHVTVRFWKDGADTKDDPDLACSAALTPTMVHNDGAIFSVFARSSPVSDLRLSERVTSIEDIREGRVQIRIFVKCESRAVSASIDEVLGLTAITGFRYSIGGHEVDALVWSATRVPGEPRGTFNGRISRKYR